MISLILCGSVSAQDFKVMSLFSDGMVIQRDTLAPVWGKAAPGTKVKVCPSWGEAVSCRADAGGRWRACIATPEAGGPHSIRISAKGYGDVTVSDVMSGEVWICSGQSNMDMPMKGWGQQYIDGAEEALLRAGLHQDRIRVFHITADTTSVPQHDVQAVWRHTDMQTLSCTSALAYFFAVRITEMLDVPVGIVVNPWGGSRIQTWMRHEDVESALEGKVEPARLYSFVDRPQERECCPDVTASCYNGRIHPLRGFAARGFLWYQGESDRMDHDVYDDLMTAFAARLRSDWGDDSARMPFLFVTMAPWGMDELDRDNFRPFLVESQLACLKTIPNSYAAVTETLGSFEFVHPPYKREIADQLALLAFEKTYGLDAGVDVGFPYPSSIEYRSGAAFITMGNCNGGIVCHDGGPVAGFEVAGPDMVFRPASAEIHLHHRIKVWSAEVPEPVAVRYGFGNYTGANLRSTFGVPVPSFRTDGPTNR